MQSVMAAKRLWYLSKYEIPCTRMYCLMSRSPRSVYQNSTVMCCRSGKRRNVAS